MTDRRTDGLDRMRAAVAAHEGPARARPLIELGQALADRYWRTGAGRPAGRPVLDEAIEVLTEAYRYFAPDDAIGGHAANLLGWLHGLRHAAHGGSEADREAGIAMLTTSARFTRLPPVLRAIGQVTLGQLLLSRVTAGLQTGGLGMLQSSGAANPDAERAVACFQQVLGEPAVNADITAVARTLLSMAEAIRDITGGNLDLGRMMAAMATMQRLQQEGVPGGVIPPLFDGADLAGMDPLKRPTPVVDGEPRPRPTAAAPASPAPTARPGGETRPAAPRARAATFREPLRMLVPGPETILAWLADDRPAPAVDVVDEVLALAASVVAAEGAEDLDHLLLATGLYLRGRDQIDGWAAGDLDRAVESLLRAAPALPAAPAGWVIAAGRLAARLDARRPGAGARPGLARHFAGVTAALGDDEAVLFGAGGHAMLLTPGGLDEHDGALPGRVLVVGDAPAATGPAVVSHVFSAAQIVALAARTRRPVTEDPVFVANPRGDRPGATMDALRLRREFHPRSTGLGETVENVGGAGTAAEVTARLGASILHLGCGVTADGALELAGRDTLRPPAAAGARTGGVALLPPTPHGAALAEALLAAGFVAVIGLAADTPDRVASLLYFLLHAALVDEALAPADAVRAVRIRLAGSALPDFLPADLAAAADPAAGDLLTCYGR